MTSGSHEVIPDRIEAGTYMIAAATIGESVRIENIIPEHLEALTSKLREIGINIKTGGDYFVISKSAKLNRTDVKTLGYPGFPTDLQQPLTTLLTQCQGFSSIEENIWENRFQNISYLNKMGANILIEGNKAYIKGPTLLMGEEVDATDLRAGACLIIAGLIAEGRTTIYNVEHVLRGYEGIIEKLSSLGAKISLQ
jgi:UDP-N-acetylglucosamine 1-carboxyvinyltransferase